MKIQAVRSRLDDVVMEQQLIQEQRQDCQKGSMAEKARLHEVFETMKGASPSKMGRMLAEMGLAPVANKGVARRLRIGDRGDEESPGDVTALCFARALCTASVAGSPCVAGIISRHATNVC